MSFLAKLTRGFRALVQKDDVERDMNAELGAYLDAAVREKERAGMSREDALRAARVQMGSMESVKDGIRDAGWESHLDALWRDLRYALRMFRKNPAFALVAVLSLALGIGANTAIFSLLNALMMRNLPVHAANELVLFGKGLWAGSTDGLPNRSWQLFSNHYYRELREKNQVFTDVTAIDSLMFDTHGRVDGGADPEKVSAELVSGSYFATLGVNPVLGRTLAPADDDTAGAHPLAVASFSWWKRRFANDASVVGKTVTINSTAYTIVGVAPPEFFGTTVGKSPDLWIPLSMEKELSPGWNGLDQPLFQSLYIIARLKPGVSAAAAEANTNLLFKQFLNEVVGVKPSPKEVASIQHAKIDLTPAARGLSELRQQFSSPLTILMALVGLVLLITCANLGNLLLARTNSRQREIAVRVSLGASRGRLMRQFLTESLLLASVGALFGLKFAWWTSRVLVAMMSGSGHVIPLDVAPDGTVLLFTLLVTVVTAALFGLAPALRCARIQPASSLKEGRGTTGTASRGRLGRGLIVGQVALSLMLLGGSGLFLKSLRNLMNVDTGFNKEGVLQFQLDETSAGYKEDAHLESLFAEIEGRVEALPGVHAASFSFFTFNQGEWSGNVSVPGHVRTQKDDDVLNNIVGTHFFDVMQIPLVLGRVFGPQDTAASQKVAVINQTMAKIYFPDGSPVGRQFGLGDDPPNIQVVGVVKDAKYLALSEKPQPAAYYPHAQKPQYFSDFVVRYSGDPKALIPAVRRAVAEVNRNVPVGDVQSLADVVDDSVSNERLLAQLSAAFGLLAVFLACIGIYGLMSYSVSQRTNEIGIRVALGAGRSKVLWMILSEILRLVAIGIAIGIPVTFAADRLARDVIFGLSPSDPEPVLAAIILMVAVGVLAGYLPARRAARVDPMLALRCE